MDLTAERKRLTRAYKEARAAGAVIAYVCDRAGKRLVMSCPDLKAQQNRFAFSVATDSCVLAKLAPDWKRFGPSAFRLEVLEPVTQGETQSRQEYLSDLETLCALWREKYGEGELYG